MLAVFNPQKLTDLGENLPRSPVALVFVVYFCFVTGFVVIVLHGIVWPKSKQSVTLLCCLDTATERERGAG